MSKPLAEIRTLEELQRSFVEKQLGMFLSFNIMSYGATWGEADFDIGVFNPSALDCGQWADAACSAGMTFGLLTTKHHEGFCLWDSKYTEYDVASTPYKKDIVRQFVDAFRERSLGVVLYYSIWDSTHGIDKGTISPQKIDFVKGQITELLTNYGAVDVLVIDGWFWRMGHREVPFNEIRNLVRRLQPECLLIDHTYLQGVFHVDVPYFEGPCGAYPREDNTMPGAFGMCIAPGNGWFWGPETATRKNDAGALAEVIRKSRELNERFCTVLVNCMPDRLGRLDDLCIEQLREIGEARRGEPPVTRELPPQGPQLQYPVPAVSASAGSGNPEYAIDLIRYEKEFEFWITDNDFPQWITLDLGAAYSGLELVACMPNCRGEEGVQKTLKEGNITSYRLSISNDNVQFRQIAEGEWEADAKLKIIAFPADTGRYLKLEVLSAFGGRVILTALSAGVTSLQHQTPQQR